MGFSFAERLALLAVAAVALVATGCGGGESEPSPGQSHAATASPAVTGSPTSTATATPSPSPTAAPTVEETAVTATSSTVATPTEVAPSTTSASPTATPSPTPRPTVPAAPTLSAQSEGVVGERWQPQVLEIATDYEALGRVQYAPGEAIGIRIGAESGFFFLNVETGAVEGWVSERSRATTRYSPSPGNRYVFRQGLLHDRGAGRTFVWDAPLVLHVPGLVVQSSVGPVEGRWP